MKYWYNKDKTKMLDLNNIIYYQYNPNLNIVSGKKEGFIFDKPIYSDIERLTICINNWYRIILEGSEAIEVWELLKKRK